MNTKPASSGGTGNGIVLAINAGSSSIKAAAFETSTVDRPNPEIPILSALVERIGQSDASGWLRATGQDKNALELTRDQGLTHDGALGALVAQLQASLEGLPIVAVGHRIVHGGQNFTTPVLVDDTVLATLETLVPLARTHQPHGLAGVRAAQRALASVPQVACFDTAFHATIPNVARAIALPEAVRKAGVQRYGFHGLSYQWLASRLHDVMPGVAGGRIVAAHLGNGASLCGLVGGQSTATTMGFTPLDGLVMGERPGLTDPGAVLFMLEEMGLTVAEVREALFKKSGLLGLSNLTNDMRTLSASDDPACAFAIEVYVHRVVREISAMVGEIGGIDGLVFTGGVGENAADIREQIVHKLGWLGFTLDPSCNGASADLVSTDQSKPIAIIAANEEAVIARQTLSCLGGEA